MYLWSLLLARMKAVNTMTMIRAGTSRHIFPTCPPPTPQGLEWSRTDTLFNFADGLPDEPDVPVPAVEIVDPNMPDIDDETIPNAPVYHPVLADILLVPTRLVDPPPSPPVPFLSFLLLLLLCVRFHPRLYYRPLFLT